MSGAARAAPLAALAVAIFAVLAVAAAGAEGRLPGDGAVMAVLDAMAPVSSDDVHIDPVLDVATLVAGALTAVVAVALLLRGEVRAAVHAPVSIVAAVLVSRAMKEIVERPAIEGPADGFSFPSGSATWCMATFAALFLLAGGERERRLVLAAGIPFTLVYAAIIAWEEWHHPSDVLAGWCLGLTASVTCWVLLGRPRARPLRAAEG